jgi:mRNA-degrading endonuclease toxin of MazEF toxin-antitoxin module
MSLGIIPGDAFWVDADAKGNELRGRHIYIVVQTNVGPPLSTAICVPASDERLPTAYRVELEVAGVQTVACPEQARALSIEHRLTPRNFVGNVGAAAVSEIRNCLAALLGFD